MFDTNDCTHDMDESVAEIVEMVVDRNMIWKSGEPNGKS